MDQQQQQLRTWFDAIDTNRSGELDASELQQALRLGNLHFGVTDVVSCCSNCCFAVFKSMDC
jgi:Ca2+-binding EF-hand superfamily protein